MDFDRLSSQFLRAVRGSRSQVAFSRRLGFRSNPVADWEAGRRVPTAAMALRACEASSVDVHGAFARFHPPSVHLLGAGDDAGVAAWLNAVRGSQSISTLGRRVERSRSAVSRWMSGTCRPQLHEFFALVHAITGRVSDLIAELVDIENVPEVRGEYRARQAAKRLAYEEPWTEAILRIIETTGYRCKGVHLPGWIASELGIDDATELRCLRILEDSGVIEMDNGLYRSGSLTVDTFATKEEMNQLKAHWTQVALQRLASPKEADIFSYNVMSVSREALSEINEVIRRAYREIRSIAAAPQTEEVVAHVNLQLLNFGEAESR